MRNAVCAANPKKSLILSVGYAMVVYSVANFNFDTNVHAVTICSVSHSHYGLVNQLLINLLEKVTSYMPFSRLRNILCNKLICLLQAGGIVMLGATRTLDGGYLERMLTMCPLHFVSLNGTHVTSGSKKSGHNVKSIVKIQLCKH